MVAITFLLAALVGAASAIDLHAAEEEQVFAALLRRQAPGSPSYNCHDNCGQAITLSKRPDPCKNEAFKSNYNNCLQCAGPDNYNIWRMYGNTLSTAGASCGFSTTPLSGKQPDVGPAVPASNASSSSTVGAAVSSAAASASPSNTVAPSSRPTNGTPVSSASIIASPTTNATASNTGTAPPQQSVNAGSHAAVHAGGVVGAVFLGTLFGLQY